MLLADLQASIGSVGDFEQHLEAAGVVDLAILQDGLCNGVVVWFEVCIPQSH